MRRHHTRLLAAGATVLLALSALGAPVAADESPGQVRITEWMYDGPGGEFVELTNVGSTPVDLTGWVYDDDSADPAVGFDLSAFGTVWPGESVVFVEVAPQAFRADWGLDATVKVIGPYSNNLGRADQVNIFDAEGTLVDRLTYGDNTIGGIRTTGASGWVSATGLGADDVFAWTLSTVGDAEGSWASGGGAVGSPGISVHGGDPGDPGEPVEPGEGRIHITEWMYNTGDDSAGEFVELTNTGDAPVDLTGWSYDDDSANPAIGFDLSGFGTVAPGETVVFTEIHPDLFRADWGLCAEAKVIGPYSNNLGRADQINMFDADGELVDRLTYGDNTIGGIRTNGVSGWVSAAGLGADDVLEWTRSAAGDAERSWQSAAGWIGSPGISTHGSVDPCGAPGTGQVRITEWMYDGPGGEFVELTNVGASPVDLAGWVYDDDSADPAIGFDLSGFGVLAPGESAVFVETAPEAFRADWNLCAGTKVIGPYSNNLGRADQINIFDAEGALVDRLTYGDNTVGGIRTQNASGWVSASGLGADDALAWTLSTVGDGEGSWLSGGGAVGSPGVSTHGGYDPCSGAPEPGAPTVAAADAVVVGAVGDPTNPGTVLTVTDEDDAVTDVVVGVASSNEAVLPAGNVTVTGTGAERTVAFEPVGRGTATVTFTATDPGGASGQTTLVYAASGAAADPSGRYHHGISDASGALDVGDGYAVLINDETNTLFLHRLDVSGPPVKTWTFTAAQIGTSSEVDFEGIARSGDVVVVTGSHGNNREGQPRVERRTVISATITGSGAGTELTFRGRYTGLWADLLAWDGAGGHGLGADALGFAAAAAPGVQPNAPDGFNIEAAEFAPDGSTLLLGFRAPTVSVDGTPRAVVVPVLDAAALLDGVGGGPAQFGAPLLLDLDGRSVRAIASNDVGEYLISAGPSPQNPSWALYSWDGAGEPVPDQLLPDEDLLTGGVWEGIAAVPSPLAAGATVRLVTDSGDTDFYGIGQTKDLPAAYQKSSSQEFTLVGPDEEPEPGPDPWRPGTVYLQGDRVSHGGGVFEALWWTQNQVPGDPWGPWQEVAEAPDGTALWTASRVFVAGDVVVYRGSRFEALWWTRNQVPGDPWGPWHPLPG